MKKKGSISGGAKTILIVDDNPQNLQVLAKQLEKENYNIEFAINGAAALEWLDSRLFDLILLDINMPGLSGFDVCSEIRRKPEFTNIPIIFLTANTERESILQGFELGAQDYITKPFDSRELLVRVRTHLSLKDSLERLEDMNRLLEEKVAERTVQLKSANEKLAETNLKLVELDKAKSAFLNLISHEIRTPLNGIIGPMELLKGPFYASDLSHLIGILDHSVKRLERFALDALLITRLRTRPNDIRKEDLSLPDVIKAIVSDYKETLNGRDLKVTLVFEPDGKTVKGENELVGKAVRNIFENAIHFSPMGGSITVATRSDSKNIECEIKDEGKGFSQSQLSHLFELFTNADRQRDDSKGIGLPVVKLIMNAHGGDVLVGNNPSGGAMIRLKFPA